MDKRARCKRCAELEEIVLSTWWMARRYATGRLSYAPGLYNNAIEKAKKLGLKLQEDTIEVPSTIYAKWGRTGNGDY